jgi:hypothetical protein
MGVSYQSLDSPNTNKKTAASGGDTIALIKNHQKKLLFLFEAPYATTKQNIIQINPTNIIKPSL